MVNQPPGVQAPTGLDWETFEVMWDPECSVLKEPCTASLIELDICKSHQLSVAFLIFLLNLGIKTQPESRVLTVNDI